MLMALFLVAGNAFAQTAIVMPLIAGDTAVNTTAVTKAVPVTAGYSVAGFQPVLTKISGTVAGKTYLLARLDGTNWVRQDSITNLDITTNTTLWSKANPAGTQYAVQVVGTGTMSAQLRVWYVLKRHD